MFEGSPPVQDASVFSSDPNVAIYYENTAGWSSTYDGVAAQPIPLTYTTSGGVVTITGYTGGGGEVTIPATIAGLPVTSIGLTAFQNCTSLTGVIIPSSVTNIGSQAFQGCTGLATVSIPSSVTSIGSQAFQGCTGLTSVAIPSSVTNIGDEAFSGCTGLTNVTIPSSVTSIGNGVYSGCAKLAYAVFDGDAPTMGTGVFSGTSSGFVVYYPSAASGYNTPIWDGYTSLVASPLQLWQASHGKTGYSLGTTLPNLGGISLLTAYALNLDPNGTPATNPLPQLIVTGDYMNYTFYAGHTDVNYTVEASSNLRNWSSSQVSVSATDSNGNRTATVPLSSGLHFMKLVVSY